MRYEVRYDSCGGRYPWRVILVRDDGTESRVGAWQVEKAAKNIVKTLNKSLLRNM